MNNKKKTIIESVVAMCAVGVIIGIFFLAHSFGYDAYANEPYGTDSENKIKLVVEAGEDVMSVANNLEEKKMISSKEVFWFRSKFSEYDGLMKAGTYEINETMGIDDILEVITQTGTEK